MAFFGIAPPSGGGRIRSASRASASVSLEFLHKHECAACPLNKIQGARHPNMPATGAKRARVYVLGENPDADDDARGEPFSGKAGRLLRRYIPQRWLPEVRFNNVVRTRPPKRAPVMVEVEACRPSILRDIGAARPEAILGLGNVPLGWAGISDANIALWSGRRVPVVVGGKPIWYFPIMHPSAVLRDPKRRESFRELKFGGSELEFQFALHIRRALQAIEAGLPEPVVHTREFAEEGVEWVTGAGGQSDLDRVLAHLRRAATRKVAGLDYETSGSLRPYAEGAKLLTASVSTASDGTLAFPLDHRQSQWSRRQREAVGEALRDFLYNDTCRKVVHQLAYEMEWSAFNFGSAALWEGKWGCSASQAYVLDERPGAHNLEFLCKQYFGINIKEVGGVRAKTADLDKLPLEVVLRYNGIDGKYHRLLYAAQSQALRDAGLARLYAEHVQRVPAAVLTQLRGIPVDQAAVISMGKKYMGRMRKAEDELRAMPAVRKFERRGQSFRPSANDDVKAILHDLGYHPDSVDEDALAAVKDPFAAKEIEWRKAAKVVSTYVLPCASDRTRVKLGVDLSDPKLRQSRVYSDGLAHPLTNVNRTRTSRTSAEDFNYQNWPKRGEYGSKEIRRMIKPLEPGEVIVSFDYGQIQARNVGMESLDPALIKAFWEDYDIHTDYAEDIVRRYPRWVKEGVKAFATDKDLAKKYRNRAKNEYVFPSFFGAQPRSKAETLGIPQEIAEDLDRGFWGRFNKIKRWHERIERSYYKEGYVTGLSGYRRWAPVAYNERINSPIQADESKIVLDAMIRLSQIDHDWLQANMEIHDDLTFVWPKKRVDELAEVVIRTMLTVPFEWARVTPILIEMEVGYDWADMMSPGKFGHERLGAGKFASHQYGGIDMPKKCPI